MTPTPQGDNPALSLYQLIGAPLHALVDAERQSARATADFIREVGFERDAEETGPEAEFGSLRMVRFSQSRLAEDGTPRTLDVEVPLLSMLPIPALQIKDAELDFFVKIIQASEHRAVEAPPSEPPAETAAELDPAGDASDAPARPDRLVPEDRIDFRASIGRHPGSPDSRSSLEMQIRMKIRVEQADVPAGLARFFNLLEQSVRATDRGAAGDEDQDTR